jgi:uncharacterized protein (DUF1330 family)
MPKASVIVDINVTDPETYEGLGAARAWYDSPQYVEARAEREGAALGSLIAVEGV